MQSTSRAASRPQNFVCCVGQPQADRKLLGAAGRSTSGRRVVPRPVSHAVMTAPPGGLKSRGSRALQAGVTSFCSSRNLGEQMLLQGSWCVGSLVVRGRVPKYAYAGDGNRVVHAALTGAGWMGRAIGTGMGCLSGVAVALGVAVNPRAEAVFAAARGAEGRQVWWRHVASGDLYNSDGPTTVRQKCWLLATVGNPVVNAVNTALTVAKNAGLAAHALRHGEMKIAACRLGAAMSAPGIWLGLQISAMVGVIAPMRGRRMYAGLEKHMAFLLAPCFAPITTGLDEPHLLQVRVGDDIW